MKVRKVVKFMNTIEYKGYVIMNVGYGYNIYKNGKIQTWFSKIGQCYDYIDQQ